MKLENVNYAIGVVLLVLGVLIWFTASQVLSIIFLVVLVIGALNVTGVLSFIEDKYFTKKAGIATKKDDEDIYPGDSGAIISVGTR